MTRFNYPRKRIRYVTPLSTNKSAIYIRNYRKKHPDYVQKDVIRNRQRRLDLIQLLGGARCVLCGYDKDVRALEIDHINGGGCQEARMFRSSQKVVRFYLKNPNIAKRSLRVLCANCNRIHQIKTKQYHPPKVVRVNG